MEANDTIANTVETANIKSGNVMDDTLAPDDESSDNILIEDEVEQVRKSSNHGDLVPEATVSCIVSVVAHLNDGDQGHQKVFSNP